MGVAVITGGSRGLGKAAAIKFAQEGHHVVISYQRNRSAADDVVSKIRDLGQEGLAVQMDVGKQADIDRAFDEMERRFPGIDYLFNNVGILNEMKELTSQTWEAWERILAVNVIGQWYCTKRAVMNMTRNGGGSVVYNSSISGVMAFPMASDYAAAKHAVVGMSKAQALECARHNIRINTICPGFFKSDMYSDNFGEATEMLTQTMIPAARIADPEEIANLVYWLAVEGTYCNGSSIIADGGITAGPKLQEG